MNDNSKILEKVRALLNVTAENGASEGEIENALNLIQRLMIKHNIEEKELFMSKNDIDMSEEENKPLPIESKFWQHDLISALSKCYNCEVLRIDAVRNHIPFFYYKITGFNEDRKIISELFSSLIPMIRNLYNKRYKEKCKELLTELAEINMVSKYEKPNRGIFIRSYITGFIHGIREKMQQDKKVFLEQNNQSEEFGLIVIKKNEMVSNYFNEKHPSTTSVKSKKSNTNYDAYGLGLEDGKNKNTNKQLH